VRILIVSNIPDDNSIFAQSMDNYSLGSELTKLGHGVEYLFGDDVPRWLPGRRLSPVNFSLALVATLGRIQRARGPFDIISISGGDGGVYGVIRRLAGRRGHGHFVGLSHGLEHRLWEQFRKEARLKRTRISPQHRLFFCGVLLPRVRLHVGTCDHMVCRTNEDREYIVARGWKPNAKVTHIPNGVRERFFATPAPGTKRAGLLFVGRWEWRKGVHYLAGAFREIHAANPGTMLTIIGSHFGPDHILSAFPPLTRPGVRIIPTLPNPGLVGEYLRHAILVLPSLFEATPGVMLEAMAAGLPVVTTRACGMKEVIEDGEDGFLVPRRDSQALAEAVKILLADSGLRERMGARAREKARAYTWDRIARQTEALYERLLTSGPNGPALLAEVPCGYGGGRTHG